MHSATAPATPTLLRAEPALRQRELSAKGDSSGLAGAVQGQRVIFTGFASRLRMMNAT